MTINQKYHKNYTEFGEPYQLVLPLSVFFVFALYSRATGIIPDKISGRFITALKFIRDIPEVPFFLPFFSYPLQTLQFPDHLSLHRQTLPAAVGALQKLQHLAALLGGQIGEKRFGLPDHGSAHQICGGV